MFYPFIIFYCDDQIAMFAYFVLFFLIATDHNKLSSSSDGHMMVAPLTEGSPNQPAAIKSMLL